MRKPVMERHVLQGVVAVACLVPLITGGQSIVRGVGMIKGVALPPPADLDSHFRYLSGIFFMLGVAFASTVPAIERQGPRFRMLAAMVVAGGLARALSWIAVGPPSSGHRLGLVMELGVVPLLTLWQWSLARRFGER